jgi:hypothetical protein
MIPYIKLSGNIVPSGPKNNNLTGKRDNLVDNPVITTGK